MTTPQTVNADQTVDRTPAVSNIRPFTVDERNWFRDMYNTVGQMADEGEMDLRMIPQNASSPVTNNQENNLVNPNIFLFKTTRETNGISPYNILPEEYQPLKSRVPNPITEPSGVLPELDGDTASEMLVKVSIMGLIRNAPNLSLKNLTNHLNGFSLKSRAINTEFLNRVQTQKLLSQRKQLKLFKSFITKQLPI